MTPHRIETFFKAIEKGSVTTVRVMIEEEPALVHASGRHNANVRDKTPLMYALQCQHFVLARLLVQGGADVKARMTGGPGSSVIQLAVRFVIAGQSLDDLAAFVRELIDAGADPSEALWPACHAYHRKLDQPELIELLLKHGANPDLIVGNTGCTVRRLVEVNAALYSPRVLKLFGLPAPRRTDPG